MFFILLKEREFRPSCPRVGQFRAVHAGWASAAGGPCEEVERPLCHMMIPILSPRVCSLQGPTGSDPGGAGQGRETRSMRLIGSLPQRAYKEQTAPGSLSPQGFSCIAFSFGTLLYADL